MSFLITMQETKLTHMIFCTKKMCYLNNEILVYSSKKIKKLLNTKKFQNRISIEYLILKK